jgi:hypothetical protein
MRLLENEDSRATCDSCGDKTLAWSEMKLDAEEFLAIFDDVKKKTEGGKVVFRFCPACVFETPENNADMQRLVTLNKQTIGLNGIDPAFLN